MTKITVNKIVSLTVKLLKSNSNVFPEVLLKFCHFQHFQHKKSHLFLSDSFPLTQKKQTNIINRFSYLIIVYHQLSYLFS